MKPPLRALRARLARRSHRPGRLPLGLEIAIIVALKVAVLVWIHHAFFAAPQAPHMRMPAERVSEHILAVPILAHPKAAPVSNLKSQGSP